MVKRQLANTKQHTFTSFDGIDICYETTPGLPNKPTLVFLHGMGGDLTAWDRQRQYFQDKGFPTIAIDLRGHGFSGRPHQFSAYEFPNFAKDISLVLKHEQSKNYILIGHCLGGIISIVGLGQQLFTPQAAILISTGYASSPFAKFLTHQKSIKFLLKLFAQIPLRFHLTTRPNYNSKKYIGTNDIDIRRLFLDIAHTSLQSLLSTLTHLVMFGGFPLLKQITVPTLVVTGQEDSFFPVNIAQTMAKHIHNAKLIIVPQANHIIVLNNPEELFQIMDTFIKQLNN